MAVSADEIQMALGGLHLEVKEVLTNFWRTLDLSNPAHARNELLEFMPMLLGQYGSKAASIAADWYDELRYDFGFRDTFITDLGGLLQPEFVQQRTRFGAGHLWTDTPDGTLLFLSGAITGWVTDAFNGTLELNMQNDPDDTWVIRKPEPDACKWCLTLGSRSAAQYRNAVYSTTASATRVVGRGIERQLRTDSRGRTQMRGGGVKTRGTREIGQKYHDYCRCISVPLWVGSDVTQMLGFDPEDLLARYRAGEFDADAPATHDRERHKTSPQHLSAK